MDEFNLVPAKDNDFIFDKGNRGTHHKKNIAFRDMAKKLVVLQLLNHGWRWPRSSLTEITNFLCEHHNSMKFLLFVTKDTEGNPLYRQMKESEYIDKIKRMIMDIKNSDEIKRMFNKSPTSIGDFDRMTDQTPDADEGINDEVMNQSNGDDTSLSLDEVMNQPIGDDTSVDDFENYLMNLPFDDHESTAEYSPITFGDLTPYNFKPSDNEVDVISSNEGKALLDMLQIPTLDEQEYDPTKKLLPSITHMH